MAICHRAELRVYDRTGSGSYTVLPATDIKWSWQLGGAGFLSATVEATAEPIASTPDLLDDCVIKVAVPLAEPGTTLTEVAAFANRGRNGILWAGAGQRRRYIRQAPTLFTAWSQDAILHPEGNAILQMTGDQRYFGWMSTIYDPADDPGQWGTPSANAGKQNATTGSVRAGQPADWPTELGDAYWITRGATANGARHLFIADCVVPSDAYLTVYFSADESCAVYFGGELVIQTSTSETGYQTMSTWSGYVTAGTYRVAIDKTSVVSRGGDGRDPVLLAVATVDDVGDPDTALLLTNTSDWQIYTTDPIDGTVPSLTPGAIVAELHAQAGSRGVDTWATIDLDFDADVDSAGQPWPVREERAWRIAYDRHLDMLEGLGDLGFCPELTPTLTLKAWGDRGTDRSATVTLATLDEVARVDEAGVGVAATYMPVETQDGWVIVENPVGEAVNGRREAALSLGNAPSIAQGKRLGQKVLDDRLARAETEWAVQFYARAGSVPFVDFDLGDTVMVSIDGTPTPRVILDLAAEQDHTEGIIRWTAKTGDVARVGRFATEPGDALASGAAATFTGDPTSGAAIFVTLVGTATAAGEVGSLTGGEAGAAVFAATIPATATAEGAVADFIGDTVTTFTTLAGTATAEGAVADFIGGTGSPTAQYTAASISAANIGTIGQTLSDLSGNGYHGTVATTGMSIVTAATPSGASVISTGGATQYFTLPAGAFNGTSQGHLFVYFKSVSSSGNRTRAPFFLSSTTSVGNHWLYSDEKLYEHALVSTRISATPTMSVRNAWRILEIEFDGSGNYTIRLDGTSQHSASNTFSAPTAPRLGNHPYGTSPAGYHHIAEFRFYSTALSSTAAAAVRAELVSTYGSTG